MPRLTSARLASALTSSRMTCISNLSLSPVVCLPHHSSFRSQASSSARAWARSLVVRDPPALQSLIAGVAVAEHAQDGREALAFSVGHDWRMR